MFIVVNGNLGYFRGMQVCNKCSIAKPKSEFFFRDKRKGTLHRHCKQCYSKKRKSYYQEHYQKYQAAYKLRALSRNNRLRIELRKRLLEYLYDKSCTFCGVSDIRVLDFDHINPSEKAFSVARALTDCVAWDRILAEIKKCQILCANCHRIRTAEQFGWYRK
jgi:hypothetical protein